MSAARLLLLCLLLAGCAGAPQRPPTPDAQALADRAENLGAWVRWGLTGRLGLDDGTEGGSGRLDWAVDGPNSEMHFRGALGRGAWQLTLDARGATLERADGTSVSAPTVSGLVAQETGLHLPVSALHWWVRGLPDPGSTHERELDADGLLVELRQLGWVVRYRRYMDYGTLMMPRRIEAVNGEQRVSLAVSQWWHANGAPDA